MRKRKREKFFKLSKKDRREFRKIVKEKESEIENELQKKIEESWEKYFILADLCKKLGLKNEQLRLLKKIDWRKFDPCDFQKFPRLQTMMEEKLQKLINWFFTELRKDHQNS